MCVDIIWFCASPHFHMARMPSLPYSPIPWLTTEAVACKAAKATTFNSSKACTVGQCIQNWTVDFLTASCSQLTCNYIMVPMLLIILLYAGAYLHLPQVKFNTEPDGTSRNMEPWKRRFLSEVIILSVCSISSVVPTGKKMSIYF